MDLSKVISISGMSGLYKVIAQTKNGFIVESLVDGKRIPAYSHYRISGLDDISVFTTGEDKPLKDVYKAIMEKEKNGPAIEHKAKDEELKKYFEAVVPDYDKERVHISDIRKAIQWYNILQKTDLLTKEPEKSDENDKISTSLEENKKQHQNIKETSKHVKTEHSKVKTQGVRKTGAGGA
jgi:hypothetical protein